MIASWMNPKSIRYLEVQFDYHLRVLCCMLIWLIELDSMPAFDLDAMQDILDILGPSIASFT